MQHYFNTLLSPEGRGIQGASVAVRNGSGALITLYSDNGVTTKPNPVLTDASGEFDFWAANGTYSLQITLTGYASETIGGLVMFDPADAAFGGLTPEQAELLSQVGGKLNASEVGVSVASLVAGKVPAAQLPAFVDEIVEYASTAAFPATGTTAKIYIAVNSPPTTPSRSYRWGGTAYYEISPSPGSTDDVAEGATNKYHTDARVRAVTLAGLDTSVAADPLSAGDTILQGMGKLQVLINGLTTGKAPIASPAFTGTPTAPTPSASDNSTKVATTAFVAAAVAAGGGGGGAAVPASGSSVIAVQGSTMVGLIVFDTAATLGAIGITANARDSVIAATRLAGYATSPMVRVSEITGASTDGDDLVIQADEAIENVYIGIVGGTASAYTVVAGATITAATGMTKLSFVPADNVRAVHLVMFPATNSGQDRNVLVRGLTGSIGADPAGLVSPGLQVAPTTYTGWWPLHDGTGTALTSGFSSAGELFRTASLTLIGTTTGVWANFGVLTCDGSNYGKLVATGDDLTWLRATLALDTLWNATTSVGGQILIGMRVRVPDLTANTALVSVGDLSNTTDGGWSIELNTGENVNFNIRGQGGASVTTTASATSADLTGTTTDWIIVFDIRASSATQLTLTTHVSNGTTAVVSSTSAAITSAGAGTAPPRLPVELNLGARKNGASTYDRIMPSGGRFENFWVQRRATISTTIGATAATQMKDAPGDLPRILRG